uniref:RING-type domain-containing protein n=1 Tax=Mastacembelus armatus TaxID=205130 RepID=A0A7N8XMQ7_9TELE
TDLKPAGRQLGVSEEQRLSSCALCQEVLKDPVSTSCGHWFCRQCITSYWDQSVEILCHINVCLIGPFILSSSGLWSAGGFRST